VSVGTSKKLAGAAKALQFHYNGPGRLLDLFADLLVSAAAGVDPASLRRVRSYARLSEDSVRAIRKSDSKVLSLAVEHGISERQVVRIRAREAYRWVR